MKKRTTIYDNHKAQRPLDQFFETKGEMKYKWRGEEYEINKKNFTKLDPALQQSFTHFCANEYRQPKPKPKPMGSIPTESTISPFGPNKVSIKMPKLATSTELQRMEIVKRELIRIATTVTIVEEKLDYPRVFKALLSQPHTALDQLKKHEEYKINLTMIVDENIGYHQNDRWFHNTLIEAGRSIKGINVYSSNAIRGIFNGDKKKVAYNYYTELLAALPKEQQKKILVFTQGCGHTDVKFYEGIKEIKKNITFCTWFNKGENCGCNQIACAEHAGLSVNYAIRNPKDLTTLLK